MLLGILSDTHGHTDAAIEGVRLLREAGAEYFIHCGDVGSNDVLDALAGESAAFVFGNCDWDRAQLERYARLIGVRCLGDGDMLQLDDKQVFVTHGDNARLLRAAVDGGAADYILLGHSHIAGERRLGKTRLINPGALYRATVKTVALLDLRADTVRWLKLEAFGDKR